MTKLSKFVAGLVASVALVMSGIPAQAQSSLPYVSRNAFHITTATTTVVSSADAYIASIVVTTSSVGTGFVASVTNGEATAKTIMAAPAAAAVGSQTLLAGSKDAAIYSKSGIKIVTTGTPGVIDVFVTYYRP